METTIIPRHGRHRGADLSFNGFEAHPRVYAVMNDLLREISNTTFEFPVRPLSSRPLQIHKDSLLLTMSLKHICRPNFFYCGPTLPSCVALLPPVPRSSDCSALVPHLIPIVHPLFFPSFLPSPHCLCLCLCLSVCLPQQAGPKTQSTSSPAGSPSDDPRSKHSL